MEAGTMIRPYDKMVSRGDSKGAGSRGRKDLTTKVPSITTRKQSGQKREAGSGLGKRSRSRSKKEEITKE